MKLSTTKSAKARRRQRRTESAHAKELRLWKNRLSFALYETNYVRVPARVRRALKDSHQRVSELYAALSKRQKGLQ